MFSSIFSGYPPSALFSRDILKVLQMCITSLWCHLSSHNPDGFLVLSMDSESLSSQQLSLLSTSYILHNGYILLQSLEVSSVYTQFFFCFVFYCRRLLVSQHFFSKSLLISTCIIIFIFFYRYFRRKQGTPLQYSCLENPMDRGAW